MIKVVGQKQGPENTRIRGQKGPVTHKQVDSQYVCLTVPCVTSAQPVLVSHSISNYFPLHVYIWGLNASNWGRTVGHRAMCPGASTWIGWGGLSVWPSVNISLDWLVSSTSDLGVERSVSLCVCIRAPVNGAGLWAVGDPKFRGQLLEGFTLYIRMNFQPMDLCLELAKKGTGLGCLCCPWMCNCHCWCCSVGPIYVYWHLCLHHVCDYRGYTLSLATD